MWFLHLIKPMKFIQADKRETKTTTGKFKVCTLESVVFKDTVPLCGFCNGTVSWE